MRNRSLLRLSLHALLALGISVPAAAQVRTWVSSTGVDNATCTRQAPCRNFDAAILAVAAGGEVVALDSAGYGSFSVTKNVTVLAPEGVHAAIAPTSGTAVTVSTANRVVLKNLFLNSQGGSQGISASSMGTLLVDGCVVQGFSTGINAVSDYLVLTDSSIRFNSTGLNMVDVQASIDRSRFQNNTTVGASARDNDVTITNSVFSGNVSGITINSMEPSNPTSVVVESSAITHNGTGISTSVTLFGLSARGYVSRCVVSQNNTGLSAFQDLARIDVSESIITRNATGVLGSPGPDGGVYSRGDNSLRENTTNGVFDGTFPSN